MTAPIRTSPHPYRRSLRDAPLYLILAVVLGVTLLPFAWVLLSSLNTTKGIFEGQIVPSALQ